MSSSATAEDPGRANTAFAGKGEFCAHGSSAGAEDDIRGWRFWLTGLIVTLTILAPTLTKACVPFPHDEVSIKGKIIIQSFCPQMNEIRPYCDGSRVPAPVFLFKDPVCVDKPDKTKNLRYIQFSMMSLWDAPKAEDFANKNVILHGQLVQMEGSYAGEPAYDIAMKVSEITPDTSLIEASIPAHPDDCLSYGPPATPLHGTTYLLGSEVMLKLDHPICVAPIPRSAGPEQDNVMDINLDVPDLLIPLANDSNKNWNTDWYYKSFDGKTVDVSGNLHYSSVQNQVSMDMDAANVEKIRNAQP